MKPEKREHPWARRIGALAGKCFAKFGIGKFQGYEVIYSPIYPNVGAVPCRPLGIGIDSFLLCNSFIWRQHLKGQMWATSILQHEVAHLKDFEQNAWQLLPLVTLRIAGPHFRSIRILEHLFYLYLEGKANLRALKAGASPPILALSYLSYLRAFRRALRSPRR
jgi:hypothetical protein